MTTSKYGKYIMTDIKLPEEMQQKAPEYAKWATRVAWLDGNVIEGAFYVACSWYLKVPEKAVAEAHVHDFDEVIGFFGSNPQDFHDLGGEVELWLEDEKHILTRSCLTFIPAGMKHCPLRIKRIDRPFFHFSTGTGGRYVRAH